MPADRQPTAAAVPGQRPAVAPRAPTQRSRVGNGRELMAGVDRRTAAYREYCDVVADLTQHLAGDPTVAEAAIIEEAAGLIVFCRRARSALLDEAEGSDAKDTSPRARFDLATYTTAVNALRRLLADLGLQRRSRDVTPTLEQFLQGHAALKAAATDAEAA